MKTYQQKKEGSDVSLFFLYDNIYIFDLQDKLLQAGFGAVYANKCESKTDSTNSQLFYNTSIDGFFSLFKMT